MCDLKLELLPDGGIEDYNIFHFLPECISRQAL